MPLASLRGLFALSQIEIAYLVLAERAEESATFLNL